MMRTKLFILFIGFISVTGCRPTETYPVEPTIALISFVADGNKGILTINFTDGDGDVGLTENDINPPYDNDLFIAYEEKVNGNWVAPLNSNGGPIVYAFRISNLTPEGKNKNLKGTIETTIQPYYYNFASPDSDTIRFRIKIIDRALHESNEVISDEIIR